MSVTRFIYTLILLVSFLILGACYGTTSWSISEEELSQVRLFLLENDCIIPNDDTKSLVIEHRSSFTVIVPTPNDTFKITENVSLFSKNLEEIRLDATSHITSVALLFEDSLYIPKLTLSYQNISHIPFWDSLTIGTLDIQGNPIATVSDSLMTTVRSNIIIDWSSQLQDSLSDTLNRWINLHYNKWPYNSTVYPILSDSISASVRSLLTANGYILSDDDFVEPYLHFLGDEGYTYQDFTLILPAPNTTTLTINQGYSDLQQEYSCRKIFIRRPNYLYTLDTLNKVELTTIGDITQLVIDHADSLTSPLLITHIDLQYQQLTSLPQEIGSLRFAQKVLINEHYGSYNNTKPCYIDLRHNQINSLSPTIRTITYGGVGQGPQFYFGYNCLQPDSFSYFMKSWIDLYSGDDNLWETQCSTGGKQ